MRVLIRYDVKQPTNRQVDELLLVGLQLVMMVIAEGNEPS